MRLKAFLFRILRFEQVVNMNTYPPHHDLYRKYIMKYTAISHRIYIPKKKKRVTCNGFKPETRLEKLM